MVNVTAATNKTHNPALTGWFFAGEKKIKIKIRGKGEEKREEYAKPRTRRDRLSYWKIGLTTIAAQYSILP